MVPPTHDAVFRYNSWQGDLEGRKKLALAEVARIDQYLILASDIRVLSANILAETAASRLTIHCEDMWREVREEPAAKVQSAGLPPLRIDLHVPVTGPAELLQGNRLFNSAGTYTIDAGRQGYRITLSLLVDDDANQDDDVDSSMAEGVRQWRVALAAEEDRINGELERHRLQTQAEVEELLNRRRNRLRLVHTALDAADIRLSATDTEMLIPLTPARLTLQQADAAVRAGGSESRLASDIADSLMASIASFGKALERSPSTTSRLLGAGEESLRDVLLFILNANWEGNATGETFIGQGKSDILLRWNNRDAFIAECKIWGGSQTVTNGITQLLDRYTVWRDTRVALIIFIRERRDVEGAIRAARQALREHPQTISSAVPDNESDAPWQISMQSSIDSLRAVSVTLISVVIPDQANEENVNQT